MTEFDEIATHLNSTTLPVCRGSAMPATKKAACIKSKPYSAFARLLTMP